MRGGIATAYEIEYPDDVLILQEELLRERHVWMDPYHVQKFWQWRSSVEGARWLVVPTLMQDRSAVIYKWFGKWQEAGGVHVVPARGGPEILVERRPC